MKGKHSGDPDLAAALAGDERAVARVVERWTPILQKGVAKPLLRSRHVQPRRETVKDLTQEVFMNLFRSDGKVLRAWDPERGLSLESYLRLIAERHACSLLRSARRNPWREESLEEDRLVIPSAEADPERQAGAREILDLLLERLQSEVSPYAWRLFELHFIEERPSDEVRKILRLSRDAFYQQCHRLRDKARKLRDEIAKEPKNPDSDPEKGNPR